MLVYLEQFDPELNYAVAQYFSVKLHKWMSLDGKASVIIFKAALEEFQANPEGLVFAHEWFTKAWSKAILTTPMPPIFWNEEKQYLTLAGDEDPIRIRFLPNSEEYPTWFYYNASNFNWYAMGSELEAHISHNYTFYKMQTNNPNNRKLLEDQVTRLVDAQIQRLPPTIGPNGVVSKPGMPNNQFGAPKPPFGAPQINKPTAFGLPSQPQPQRDELLKRINFTHPYSHLGVCTYKIPLGTMLTNPIATKYHWNNVSYQFDPRILQYRGQNLIIARTADLFHHVDSTPPLRACNAVKYHRMNIIMCNGDKINQFDSTNVFNNIVSLKVVFKEQKESAIPPGYADIDTPNLPIPLSELPLGKLLGLDYDNYEDVPPPLELGPAFHDVKNDSRIQFAESGGDDEDDDEDDDDDEDEDYDENDGNDRECDPYTDKTASSDKDLPPLFKGYSALGEKTVGNFEPSVEIVKEVGEGNGLVVPGNGIPNDGTIGKNNQIDNKPNHDLSPTPITKTLSDPFAPKGGPPAYTDTVTKKRVRIIVNPPLEAKPSQTPNNEEIPNNKPTQIEKSEEKQNDIIHVDTFPLSKPPQISQNNSTELPILINKIQLSGPPSLDNIIINDNNINLGNIPSQSPLQAISNLNDAPIVPSLHPQRSLQSVSSVGGSIHEVAPVRLTSMKSAIEPEELFME
jgi:hypothetical protein